MLPQSSNAGSTGAEELLSWPFTGLTRAEALHRRNRIVTWIFLFAGALALVWIAGMVSLFNLPTDTFEQLAYAIRAQHRHMMYGLLLMGVWALPIVIARWTRPFMPEVR